MKVYKAACVAKTRTRRYFVPTTNLRTPSSLCLYHSDYCKVTRTARVCSTDCTMMSAEVAPSATRGRSDVPNALELARQLAAARERYMNGHRRGASPTEAAVPPPSRVVPVAELSPVSDVLESPKDDAKVPPPPSLLSIPTATATEVVPRAAAPPSAAPAPPPVPLGSLPKPLAQTRRDAASIVPAPPSHPRMPSSGSDTQTPSKMSPLSSVTPQSTDASSTGSSVSGASLDEQRFAATTVLTTSETSSASGHEAIPSDPADTEMRRTFLNVRKRVVTESGKDMRKPTEKSKNSKETSSRRRANTFHHRRPIVVEQVDSSTTISSSGHNFVTARPADHFEPYMKAVSGDQDKQGDQATPLSIAPQEAAIEDLYYGFESSLAGWDGRSVKSHGGLVQMDGRRRLARMNTSSSLAARQSTASAMETGSTGTSGTYGGLGPHASEGSVSSATSRTSLWSSRYMRSSRRSSKRKSSAAKKQDHAPTGCFGRRKW